MRKPPLRDRQLGRVPRFALMSRNMRKRAWRDVKVVRRRSSAHLTEEPSPPGYPSTQSLRRGRAGEAVTKCKLNSLV